MVRAAFVVAPYTLMYKFCNFLLVINEDYLGFDYQRGQDIRIDQGYFQIGAQGIPLFQMKSQFTFFSHNMISKCLTGIFDLQLYNNEDLMYEFKIGDSGTFTYFYQDYKIAAKGYITINALCYGAIYFQFICKKYMSYCLLCTAHNLCTKCEYPYVLNAFNQCAQCQVGFTKYLGFCIQQQGCKNMIYQYNNPTISNDACLSCITEMNWVMDPTTRKCVCGPGYGRKLNSNNQPICVTVCGDGVITLATQDCDDGNLRQNDGCNSLCKQQNLFTCLNQPSQCTLHYDFKQVYYNYAVKIYRQNKGALSFSILPKCYKLKWVYFSKIVFINLSNTHMSNVHYQYNEENGQLLVLFDYLKRLQFQNIQTKIFFDPQVVVSKKTQFIINFQIKGINAPLILQSPETSDNFYLIRLMATILVILAFIQFFIGSYFHKMIGLQTLQCIQIIYFGLMMINGQNSSILNSLYSLKFSNGYSNSQFLYGSSDLGFVNAAQYYSTVYHSYVSLDLQKYFLQNVNLQLIPIVIVLAVYFIYFLYKNILKRRYFKTFQLQQKDLYKRIKRKSQWFYDHFVYPYILSICFIVFISTCQNLQSSQRRSSFTDPEQNQTKSYSSYPLNQLTIYIIFFIICLQIYLALLQYLKNKTIQNRTLDRIDELQHDQNDLNKKNYRCLYALVYIMFQLLFVGLFMYGSLLYQQKQQNLNIKSQLILCMTGVYFILIMIWKPYSEKVNRHNYILMINYFILIIFLIISIILNRSSNLSEQTYLAVSFIILFFVTLIILGGYYRIYLQYQYIKSSQKNSGQNGYNGKQVDQTFLKIKLLERNNKRTDQILNNPFLFENQLNEINKKYGIFNPNGMTQKQQAQLIQMLRRQNKVKYIQEELKRKNKLEQIRQLKMLQQKNNQIIMNNSQKQQQILKVQTPSNKKSMKNRNNKFEDNQYKNLSYEKNQQTDELKILKYKLRKQWTQINGIPNLITAQKINQNQKKS